jgi:hypothetical protein
VVSKAFTECRTAKIEKRFYAFIRWDENRDHPRAVVRHLPDESG